MVTQRICAGKMQRSFVWSRRSWALRTAAPTLGKKPSSQHIHFSTSGRLYGCLFFHSCVQIVWVFSWIQKLSKISDTCLFSSNIKSWASWFLLWKKSSSTKVHYSQGMDKISQVDVGEKKSRTIWNVILATNSCRNEPAYRLNRTVFLEDQIIKSRDSSKVLKP